MEQNCEIKISFLEIYKEQVTDLLEGHERARKNARIASSRRSQKDSFVRNSNYQSPLRSKSKTFCADNQDLVSMVNRKRDRMEQECLSPDNLSSSHRNDNLMRGSFRERTNTQHADRITYAVKENAIKGVYVQNLSEIVCISAQEAYHCLLDGLMRKRMSQTVRNTSSSRSHTIFQIKMYMKSENPNT